MTADIGSQYKLEQGDDTRSLVLAANDYYLILACGV